MAEDLFIPQLGQTVEEVVLINWLVEDGVKVDFGTPVLDVETDKAIFTVEANAKGYLHKGPQKAGDTVPVLEVVAIIGKQEDVFSASSGASSSEKSISKAEIPHQSDSVAHVVAREEGRIFSSPRARKLAKDNQIDVTTVTPTGNEGKRVIEIDVERYLKKTQNITPIAAAMAKSEGVNLAGIFGTGPNSKITKSDVENAIHHEAVSTQPKNIETPTVEVKESIALKGVRGLIFDRMDKSVHTTARVTLMTEVDATNFVSLREKIKNSIGDSWGFTPGYNDMLGIIVAKALRDFPYMNARISANNQSIEYLDHVNLGMAVDTDRGLTVPVVHDADRLGMREFGNIFREKIERARTNRSTQTDLSGGTFTITNLGMYDIDFFTPVINLPECSILGIGRIQAKAVPSNDEIVVRKMMGLSLVFDYRIVDGAPAAKFLQRIKQYIEEPFLMLA